MQAPKIDKRTYNQIVAQVEALAETITNAAVPPTEEMLTGRILAQDVVDPDGEPSTIPADTVLTAELARRVSHIPGLDRVQVKGWHHYAASEVAVSVEALTGRVLAQDIIEPAKEGKRSSTIPVGTVLDAELTRRIGQIEGLPPVKIIDQRSSRPLDAGGALIRIFGRFMELVVDRLNRVPEKNYLAFLNLIGADLLPPQPARVPLTFQLAAGSPVEALVPAGTRVAAPPAEGEEEEVIFETDQELVVTRAQLVEVFGREPDQDQYRRITPQALNLADEPFRVFAGDQALEGDEAVEHTLYLACDALLSLPGPTDVTLNIEAEDVSGLAAYPLIWSYWDGENEQWQKIEATEVTTSDSLQVTLQDLPPLTPSAVNGVEGSWLRARLDLPLSPARAEVGLEARAIDNANPQELTESFFPFGPNASATYFYLSGQDAFGQAGSTVTLDVKLETPDVVTASGDIVLKWEYKARDQQGQEWWEELGQSGPGSSSLEPTSHAFVDNSHAFTQAGQICFRVPPDRSWGSTSYRGRSGRWLRLKKTGSYSQPPQIRSLTAAYSWDLPPIKHLSLSPPDEEPTLKPTLGCCNTIPLDLSKAFYPFGEQPRFNDSFYLAYDEVISQGGAKGGDTVTIKVELNTVGTPDTKPVELVWEFWDGQTWQTLGRSSNEQVSTGATTYGFEDKTKAFTDASGDEISFTLPEQVALTTVNGEQSYWLRASLTGGNYGLGPSYEEYQVTTSANDTITAYRLVPATFKPPLVTSLSFVVSRVSAEIALSACQSYNDFTYVDHTADNAQSKPFVPFTPAADAHPALYLGFDAKFDNRPVTLYAQVEPPRPDEVTPARLAAMTVTARPQLTWEYARAKGDWTSLRAIDETQAFARRGLIRFVAPRDFARRQVFGQELYWLRVRWENGTFVVLPRLRRLLLNSTWASQATASRDETLGSSNGNPGQSFQLAQRPVLPGMWLEVREPDLPSPEEAAEIKKLEGQEAITLSRDAAGQVEEIWVRWHAVPDFHGSGVRDRHYTVDYLSGTVGFGDGRYGLIPPPGQNNIRTVRYRSGGGTGGNRPQESVIQLKSSVPYIDRVTNYEAASGGAARQSLDRVKRYGPRQLRHRGRAVTAEDLEDLAYAASAQVARARAIPPNHRPLDLWLDPQATTPDTTGHAAVKEKGVMGLILVPRSDSPQPIPSVGLLEQVRAYLRTRCPATADLWLAGPDWVKVTVTTIVVPTSLDMADVLPGRVSQTLARFLHPLTGGPLGKGWSFGRLPHRSELYALIESVAGVDHVRTLTMIEPQDGQTELSGHALIYSGEHDITLVTA